MFFHKDTFCVSLFQDKTLKRQKKAPSINEEALVFKGKIIIS
jgi:hypothetical protein